MRKYTCLNCEHCDNYLDIKPEQIKENEIYNPHIICKLDDNFKDVVNGALYCYKMKEKTA